MESAAPIRGGPLKRVPSFDAPLHPVAAGTVALAGPIARLPSTKENGYWVYLFKTAATLQHANTRSSAPISKFGQRANRKQVRLKTARELGRRNLKRAGSADRAEDVALDRFAGGIVRHALYGIREAAEASDLRSALNWFHTNLLDYWHRQRTLIGVLDYLGKNRSDARSAEAETAARLAGAVHNDRL